MWGSYFGAVLGAILFPSYLYAISRIGFFGLGNLPDFGLRGSFESINLFCLAFPGGGTHCFAFIIFPIIIGLIIGFIIGWGIHSIFRAIRMAIRN